jgi:UbiD family decarboxylase
MTNGEMIEVLNTRFDITLKTVERALATRMRPERDLTVIEGARADRADWTSARPPERVLKRVRRKLEGRGQ